MNANLVRDVRQFFSHGMLARFERLAEAGVSYTFDAADIYLSSYAEALDHLEQSPFSENDEQLAQYARIFENYLSYPFDCVGKRSAAIIAASLYYLSGHSANALVMARNLGDSHSRRLPSYILLSILGREFSDLVDGGDTPVVSPLREYIRNGSEAAFETALSECETLQNEAFDDGLASEYVAAVLLTYVLNRLHCISLWSSIRDQHTAPIDTWRLYVEIVGRGSVPVVDLWPSQRKAINAGLLDGSSSLVLQMPTSAGKTKMTELAFINDLASDRSRKCLYLAPFRALVSEVEKQIGGTLSALGYPVASLYGGSEANELDVELANAARVIIATPEKASAVLRLTGGALADFGTIVLDEGHLIDSKSRGAAYELQLASLKSQLSRSGNGTGRSIFLSAVIPNASEIAEWLSGSADSLVSSEWQPTSYRVAIARWPNNTQPRLEYTATDRSMLTEQFFVPRVLEQEEWREPNPETNRMRIHRFPSRGDNSSFAAALAIRFLEAGSVIVYANRPDWTVSIAKKLLERLDSAHPLDNGLVTDENAERVSALAGYVDRVLGSDSVMARCIRKGFALHHGKIPQGIRVVVEDEFRNQTLRLLISTNTLAQGVNLPAHSVVVHSLPRTDAPRRDFWNLLGRAGRATKETGGEIIVIDSGNINADTLRGFLRRDTIEAVWSSILTLVGELLQGYGQVTEENISAYLADEPGSGWRSCTRAVDISLLEVLAEDVAESDQAVDMLLSSLLATYQASAYGERTGQNAESLSNGIRQLFQARRDHVIRLAPAAHARRRFARAGLSVESCVAIDDVADQLLGAIQGSENLSDDILHQLVNVICQLEEVAPVDPDSVYDVGRAWMQGASYCDIHHHNPDLFANIDEAVYFLEDTICYRVPWVMNGMIRILEATDDNTPPVGTIPPWFKLLPAMLHYGVPSEQLVWVMSLGISDRLFARWLLGAYVSDSGELPQGARQFVHWALQTRSRVAAEIASTWPAYFGRLYGSVLDRYERILEVLQP